MKGALAALALVAGSNAMTAGSSSCCFGLTAYGGPGGPVGELSDGQNRIGQSNLPTPQGQYCLNNGGLTDGNGRGCILTPPTTQWQCDVGATPSPGFEVGCNGTLTINGTSTFYSCPTGDQGGYNIYTQSVPNEPGCVPITLQADECYSGCPMPTPMSTSSPPTSTAPPAPKATCPKELTGSWEFPHLIVPVNSASPNKAYGTSYNGTASGTVSTIFNFDIPASDAGKTCTLEFLFPLQSTLETSAYTFSGSGNGSMEFSMLHGPANADTTYANVPASKEEFGIWALAPGNAYTIADFACPAGEAVGIWMHAMGSMALNYFQDSNPCPIGLYMTAA